LATKASLYNGGMKSEKPFRTIPLAFGPFHIGYAAFGQQVPAARLLWGPRIAEGKLEAVAPEQSYRRLPNPAVGGYSLCSGAPWNDP
jgi:hypothetical protein